MKRDAEFYKNISKIGLKKRWEKEHSTVRLNKTLSKEKTAINAYLCGDGWIAIREDKNKDMHYEIRIFLDNEALAKRVASLFKKEFNIYPHISYRKGCFNVQIKNKPACLNLYSFGQYGHYKWAIPKDLPSDYLKEWIKCFFDCEAYVDLKHKYIQVKSVNYSGLESIKGNLVSLGILSKLYGPYTPKNKKHGPYGMLFVRGKENINAYKKLINFHHPDKRDKLGKITY